MLKTRFFGTFFIVLAVLFAQVGSVLAAPAAQESTPITGTIQTIEVQPGVDGGEPVVVVTVLDDMGETQTVNLSVEAAAGLNLLETDEATGELVLDPDTGLPVADQDQVGQTVEIIPEEVPDEEPFNPVAGLLASFFDVTNAEINQMHEDGFGFGLIAQALWMSTDDAGITDPMLAADILAAKQEKNFEAFFENHQEYLDQVGDDIPTNWGQFKKALQDKHENLGAAHAEDSVDDLTATQNENGKGKNKNKDKSNPGRGRNNH